MIKLFQTPRIRGLNMPNSSPPCAKLETWLRVAGVPYELAPWPPNAAPPKGKFPFIIDDDGHAIGDSTLIIEHLRRARHIDPDRHLTPVERAIGVAFRRMAKENLYWVAMHVRYREGFEAFCDVMRATALALTGGDEQKAAAVLQQARKTVDEQMVGHGLGRHSVDEVHQIGTDDLMAISEFLGDKPFFFGDVPSGVDATVYAYVTTIIDFPIDSATTRAGRGRPNLVNYCRRMRERFFSDLLSSE
jgi:glutathione S-transferase